MMTALLRTSQLLALSVVVITSCGWPTLAYDRTDQMTSLCHSCRFDEVVRIFNRDADNVKNDKAAQYLAGYAYIRLHEFREAKVPLAKAISLGFSGYPGWRPAGDMLGDVDKMEKLSPPYFEDIPSKASSKIRVFCRETDWMKPVIAALPAFLSRAQSIFGDDLKGTKFFFFDKRDDFNSFYSLIFGTNVPTDWQNGTGNSNVVVFCEQNRLGKPLTAGTKRTLGDILHECGHCICATIFGSNYLNLVPEWLNEGMADAVAAPYYTELQASYRDRLAEAAEHGPAPSYQALCKELYKDPDIRYAFADLMVQEIVKKQGIGVLRKIVVRARETQDFEKAILQITGAPSESVYESVCNKFWHS